jgi:tetratricopeptide (TPR) repeat protein
LKRLRLERGMSQLDLAVPGVSNAYISRIEAGSRQPSVKALRRLATRLNVSPEYLEFGRDIGETEERELRVADAELTLRLGDAATAEVALHALLDAALRAGDKSNAARASIALALAADDRGDHAAAVAAFEAAFLIERPSPLVRHDVFATLGRAYGALGQTANAIELYRRCLEEVTAVAPEDASLRTRYRIYLSYALSDAGDLRGADEALREALEDDDSNDDPHMQIRLHWSLARLAEMEGRSAVALRHARRAIALLEATEDDHHQARAHLLAAWILNSAGRGKRALVELEKADVLFGWRVSGDDAAMLAAERARSAALLGDGVEAERLAREAIAVSGGQYGAIHGSALAALADGLALQGEIDQASEAYAQGVDLLVQNRRWREASHACHAWGAALRRAGREEEALDVLERASTLALRTSPPILETHDA